MIEVKTNGILETYDISEVGITDGLVAWYPLDGNTRDYTEYRNDATNYGATISSGLEQTCYSFDGVDDYISCGTTIGNFGVSDFTISLWVKSNGLVNAGLVCKSNGGAPTTEYGFLINTPSNSSVGFAIASTNGVWGVDGSYSAKAIEILTLASQFNHLVIVGDRTKINIDMYVNGSMKTLSDLVGGLGKFNLVGNVMNSLNFTIGAESDNLFTNGLIQDVRVYNRALSAEEIKILYELRKNKKTHFTNDNKVFIPGKFNEVY